MAIPWFSVLQAVPWGQVIDNAPKVVDGAKRFWSSVSKRAGVDEFDIDAYEVEISEGDDTEAVAALRYRLLATERTLAELQKQMRESSSLITTLADQNAQLIQRVETNRKRMIQLTVVCIVMSVTAIAGLMYVLSNFAV
jgi:hypothetical protein